MSWTPSSPHEPRDDTRDDTVYNVPVGRVSQPPRFPGFLLAAVIAALIAFAALGAMLFSNQGEAPDPSRSPRPIGSAPSVTASPGTTSDPVPSDDPAGPSDRPSASSSTRPGGAALIEDVCAEPVAAVSGVRQSLIEVFREYCREGIEAVLAEVAPEPGTISQLAWGYAGDRPPALGADLPHYVYLARDGQRRIRRYLVISDSDTGQPVVSGSDRVPALPADVFFALSPEGG